ncbi:MAG: hypothetical protein ACMXYF_03805 [Candidatus Woesearchaeota archaeon]
MNIKVKKETKDGLLRLQTSGRLKEVLIREDLFNPKSETISLCFRGSQSSGIIELTVKEFESIHEQTRNYLHLIKSVKKI